MESLLTGFSISDLQYPSPSQILGTSSRFSGGLPRQREKVIDLPRKLVKHRPRGRPSSTSSTPRPPAGSPGGKLHTKYHRFVFCFRKRCNFTPSRISLPFPMPLPTLFYFFHHYPDLSVLFYLHYLLYLLYLSCSAMVKSRSEYVVSTSENY